MSAVTTYAGEQQAIMGRLDDNWSSLTPVAWPNAAYAPTGVAYIEPIVNRQEAFNADINPDARRIRHPGMLTVNVRVPINEGDGAALAKADLLVLIFRNVKFDGITFKAVTVRDIGPEGPWYRVQVDCPYWRDSIH